MAAKTVEQDLLIIHPSFTCIFPSLAAMF